MNNVEYAKQYIKEQIAERGLNQDGQILIDFADICNDEEIMEAAESMGYEAECAAGSYNEETGNKMGQGQWWIYKEV